MDLYNRYSGGDNADNIMFFTVNIHVQWHLILLCYKEHMSDMKMKCEFYGENFFTKISFVLQ